MKDTPITQEESLQIITKMIQTARGNFKGASFYFLFWGWIVVLANLTQYLLTELTNYEYPYIIWLVTIPAGIYTFWRASRSGRQSKVKTLSDTVIYNTWLAFIPCLLIIIFFGSYLNFHISALIMLFAGLATFITGSALDFTPLKVGSLVFWLLTPVALIAGIEWSPLVMTIAIIGGYLIPGYMLKYSK